MIEPLILKYTSEKACELQYTKKQTSIFKKYILWYFKYTYLQIKLWKNQVIYIVLIQVRKFTLEENVYLKL